MISGNVIPLIDLLARPLAEDYEKPNAVVRLLLALSKPMAGSGNRNDTRKGAASMETSTPMLFAAVLLAAGWFFVTWNLNNRNKPKS